MIESLLVILILIVLIQITVYSTKSSNFNLITDELEVKRLISKFDYLKSKALRDKQSITLILTTNATKISVIEQKGKKYNIKLNNGKITSISKIHSITFDKEGKINHFGSLILKMNKSSFKIIFHIDKGRIRYVKI